MARQNTEPDERRPGDLDEAQRTAHGDMPPVDMRAALHRTADLVADYVEQVEGFAVLPPIQPGELTRRLSRPPPLDPEPLDEILRDVEADVIPNATHWQHPGYMAYFSSSASTVGLLGEMITTGLNANAFLWRTSPIGAELEAITVGWLRDALGLPPAFDGVFNDTASISSLAALAAARQATTGDGSQAGLAGSAQLVVYASSEAHSSIGRAAMLLGIGRDGVRAIDVDAVLAMRPDALRAAIEDDLAAGRRPSAVVATVGTTSSTAIDPVAAIIDICEQHGLWLHVDAAYAGSAALIPEQRHHFAGWERADSIVINPHKWMFTPLDCSLLLTRRIDTLRAALSLTPEYLRTTDDRDRGRDYNEITPQLGRRARAIKMWMQLRYFGLSGLQARIARHIELARELAGWIEAEPDAELLAPVPFATVCFRWRPARFAGREGEADVAARLDDLNQAVMNRVNETGEVFLSHARLDRRFTIRVSIGNIRSERRHVERAWELIRAAAADLDADADLDARST